MLPILFSIALILEIATFSAAPTQPASATPPNEMRPIVVKEVRPIYTDAARNAGIQGIVGLDVLVRADGSIGDVKVVESLDPKNGLDQQAIAAVRQFEFKAGTKNGAPVDAHVRVGVMFVLPGAVLPGQVLYPVASKIAWKHLVELSQELGLEFEIRDNERYILVTRWTAYDDGPFPRTDGLGLPLADRPTQVQLHLASTPFVEPARIAVGVMADFARDGGRVRTYDDPVIEEWLFRRLTARLGASPVALPADPAERVEVVRGHTPAAVTSACAAWPGPASGRPMVSPKSVNKVQPIYPGGQEPIRAEIRVEGQLTEHGTLYVLRVVNSSPGRALLERSARLALGLWRFTPAMADGCAKVVSATMFVNYDPR